MRLMFPAAFIVSIASSPLSAAVAQPQTPDDILVIGESNRNVQREAKTYVRKLGVAVGDVQAARWFTPVCPRAVGLAKDHASLVEKQIREVARAVGAPLAREDCEANLAVVFAEDGAQLTRDIVKADPNRVRRLQPTTVRELTGGEAAVRWWYNTGVLTSDGVPSQIDAPKFAEIQTTMGPGLPMSHTATVTQHYKASNVSSQVVRDIQSATIVVDVNRAHGKLLRSIVDYAALVGLAEIKLGAAAPASILSLFNSQAAETELSDRDRAFLIALYRMDLARSATYQEQKLISAVVGATASD